MVAWEQLIRLTYIGGHTKSCKIHVGYQCQYSKPTALRDENERKSHINVHCDHKGRRLEDRFWSAPAPLR